MWGVHFVTTQKDVDSRIKKIRLFLTDNDGVLTDGCVYYSNQREELKKYNMRDGMGFERLRDLAGIETGIVTKEKTEFAIRRGEKLHLTEVHTGIENKVETIKEIAERKNVALEEIAFMGDDVNDLAALQIVGLAACPFDALPQIASVCQIKAEHMGGQGAFRCIAEYIIAQKKR